MSNATICSVGIIRKHNTRQWIQLAYEERLFVIFRNEVIHVFAQSFHISIQRSL